MAPSEPPEPGPSRRLSPRQILRDLFDAAVAAAQPSERVPRFLPADMSRPLTVLGAGKASAAMAEVVERHWQGPLKGLVVTRYGHALPCEHIEVVEAGHPVPDQSGMEAAERMLALGQELTADDTVVCLISGGGSALLALPRQGLGLEDKQAVTKRLLAGGATITEMNCVRRHLSAVKGGRLAAACHPAKVINLLISDVPGDDPADIASGPTVGDPTTAEQALELLRRYRIEVPPVVMRSLESGEAETVKADDPRLANVETHLIATPRQSLKAAADEARRAGLNPVILSDRLEGKAREVGVVMAGLALEAAHHDTTFQRPCVLLSGGETTVDVRGSGRGGRNVEFLLSLAIALEGRAGIYALAADTDGVDGAEEIAGAIIAPDTLDRARSAGLDPLAALNDNDAHGFFEALGDSVVTGPTFTNVNDFRAVMVLRGP